MESRQSWQDLQHLPLAAAARIHNGKESAGEAMRDEGQNERESRKTNQGAPLFGRALVCSGPMLLSQSESVFLPLSVLP